VLIQLLQGDVTPGMLRVLAAYLISLLFAIGLHEYAHARTAAWCGDPTPEKQGRLSLNPLAHLDPIGTLCILFVGFGWGKAVQINPYNFRKLRRDLMLTAVAGPATNILLAGLGIGFSWIFAILLDNGVLSPLSPIAQPVATLLEVFVLLNLTLAAFNLLPIGPLDGVKVVQWFLPERAAERFYNTSMQLGMLFLIIVLAVPPVRTAIFLPVQLAYTTLMPGWLVLP
jgi:Zn-dependent protease